VKKKKIYMQQQQQKYRELASLLRKETGMAHSHHLAMLEIDTPQMVTDYPHPQGGTKKTHPFSLDFLHQPHDGLHQEEWLIALDVTI